MTVSREDREKVIELYRRGISKNAIARKLNISWDTVNRIVNEWQNIENENTRYIRKCLKNIEYMEELKAMLISISYYNNIRHNILKKKIKFLLEQDEIDDDIFKEIRDEYRSLGHLIPYERLDADYKNLKRRYDDLVNKYNDLQSRYDKKADEYECIKSRIAAGQRLLDTLRKSYLHAMGTSNYNCF